MPSITARLQKLEQAARNTETAGGKDCNCPFGKRMFYFTFDNMTEEEAAAKYPYNLKHCPRCGGLNLAVRFPDDTIMES